MKNSMKGNMGPAPMKDRFKGASGTMNTARGTSRSFDNGVSGRGYQGAPVGGNQGTVRNQKTDAKFNNSNIKVQGGSGSLGGKAHMAIGRPLTAAPTYAGQKLGNGPKGGSHATGKIGQMGGTGGMDKSPKAMTNRFKGRTHGV